MILHPQLVVEIWSPTNSLKERSKKMEEYFRIGVQELLKLFQGHPESRTHICRRCIR